LLIFFGLPAIGITLDAKIAALVAITLNTAPYHSEVWRASLLSFPKDQLEAAKAAGMVGGLPFRRIVLPQVWRMSLPGIINEMTFLIKGSPAVAVVGVVDLTRAAVRVSSYTYDPIGPLMSAAVIYVAVVAVLVRTQRIIENRVMQRFGTA
jgi:ABC-type amino acid transport system permease subunit